MNEQAGKEISRWLSTGPDDLVWAAWGHDHIAYHRPSGKTHFLNASSRYLITELLCEPLALDEVVEAFAPAEIEGEQSAQTTRLCAMLERLEHLGFVRQL